ncbi:S1 RNA-binding domain-containing protein [Streptomyces sp. NPDC001478]
MLPHVHRITQYDPADRDATGAYTGTVEAVSDHGPVEAAYLRAVAAFAEESGVDRLEIREPQIAPGVAEFGAEPAVEGHGLKGLLPAGLAGFHDGAVVPLGVGLELVRVMLRDGGAWCRLEVEGRFAVHVGWDQYVYVGSGEPCEEAVARTRSFGLFPERIDASPYDIAHDTEPGEQRPADDDFWARVGWCVATGQAGMLEEAYVGNATRWHRLRAGGLDEVRGGLAPRARLAVWPGPSDDVPGVLAGLPEEGLIELVLEDPEGRITSTVADETRFAELRAQAAGARAAAVLSMDADERRPLLTAVLPDGDGVLRARWRTEPTLSDRHWALLKTLRPGQIVTGTVTEIPPFGVTFVDIGGFCAMINVPELSWRHVAAVTDVVTVGQTVTAEILGVDMIDERVHLSLKALQPDPMQNLVHQVGRVVTGRVTRLVPFGAFVRVEDREDGFEGLVHLSELADTPVEKPEDVVRVGQWLTVVILLVDPERRLIALSHKQAV